MQQKLEFLIHTHVYVYHSSTMFAGILREHGGKYYILSSFSDRLLVEFRIESIKSIDFNDIILWS